MDNILLLINVCPHEKENFPWAGNRDTLRGKNRDTVIFNFSSNTRFTRTKYIYLCYNVTEQELEQDEVNSK